MDQFLILFLLGSICALSGFAVTRFIELYILNTLEALVILIVCVALISLLFVIM